MAAAAQPSEFDIASGKALKDLQVAFAAAAAYGGVHASSEPPAPATRAAATRVTAAHPPNYLPPRFGY